MTTDTAHLQYQLLFTPNGRLRHFSIEIRDFVSTMQKVQLVGNTLECEMPFVLQTTTFKRGILLKQVREWKTALSFQTHNLPETHAQFRELGWSIVSAFREVHALDRNDHDDPTAPENWGQTAARLTFEHPTLATDTVAHFKKVLRGGNTRQITKLLESLQAYAELVRNALPSSTKRRQQYIRQVVSHLESSPVLTFALNSCSMPSLRDVAKFMPVEAEKFQRL